jgi:septum formation protein
VPLPRLVLASSSPRRAELLTAAGISFEAVDANVDETPLDHEAPQAHVRRLAEAKARAVAALHRDAMVLGADTVVVVDGRMLGKPRSPGEAAEMLRALSGREHLVLTGVAVLVGGVPRVEVETTRVRFGPLTAADVAWYVASGEPMDKAGAYAVQGLASRFVESITGSYSNVVGLPVALVWRLVKSAGRAEAPP